MWLFIQTISRLTMVETLCRTEQLDHAHVLATEDVILYVHVCNIKILFLFEGLEFLG